MKIERNDYRVKVFDGNGRSYMTTQDANVELCIDARGNRVAISIEEYRPASNRTTGASIQLSREEWNLVKKLAAEIDPQGL